jgi:MFS family permease
MDATNSTHSKKQIAFALWSIFLAYLVYSYYVQTPGIAAPRIAADLDGMWIYAWGISIPGLGLAFGTILFGKLSDIFGRQRIMLISLGIFIAGAIASALSPTYIVLIIARTIMAIGQGAISPLVFSVIGDIYPPSERGKWIGLLNIPTGIFALSGSILGGLLVDTLGWRCIFWFGIPLLLLCFFITLGMPALIQKTTRKIDTPGIVTVAIASSTLILGFSLAGTMYPWGSFKVIGLLIISVIFWALFLKVESVAEEPIVDLKVLRNRVFMTVSTASFLSFFGLMAMAVYFPLLLQGIQGMSALESGWMVTPLNVLMAFVGVPIGFLLSHTKRYKWIFISGYTLLTITMIGMIFYDASTPIKWGIVATLIGGLGCGSIPTVNTLVIQCAIPKRFLGVAMGAFFFSISMGVAIAPAILGSAMSIQYNKSLKTTLPATLIQTADEKTMNTLGNPRVLLSEEGMVSLKEALVKSGDEGLALLQQTIQGIRTSMEAGFKVVFIIAAITMLLGLLLIMTIPEISLDSVAEEEGSQQSAVVNG